MRGIGGAPAAVGLTCAVRGQVWAVAATRAGTNRRAVDTAADDSRRVAHDAVSGFARLGLVARAVFYLILAYLVCELAVGGGGGRQANAHGALSAVASTWIGKVAIGATALGFAVFGVSRVVGAVRDGSVGTWRRTTTLLQGVFYVAMAWVPLSFLLGNRSAGSEQQQHKETAGLLHLPGGREIVVAIGVVVIVVCSFQIRTALSRGFEDGIDVSGAPRAVRTLLGVAGTVGIAARAIVFLPVGAFFIVAAVQADPRHAAGLDRELADLARHPWGPAVLAMVALGLVIFAVYTLIEARYRRLARGK